MKLAKSFSGCKDDPASDRYPNYSTQKLRSSAFWLVRSVFFLP